MIRITVVIAVFLAVLGSAGAAPVVNPSNGHTYEVVLAPLGITYPEARLAAIAAGGFLASPDSPAENDFIHSLALSNLSSWFEDGTSYGPWIGGYRTGNDPDWTIGWMWEEGFSVQSFGWGAGEPNNAQNGSETSMHFIRQPGQSYAEAKWNDIPPQFPLRGYIIEVVPEPSSFLALAVPVLASLRLKRKR